MQAVARIGDGNSPGAKSVVELALDSSDGFLLR